MPFGCTDGTSNIFTVTEPGPFGAEIMHRGDVLAMCHTHTVRDCVYCDTDIKDGRGRKNGILFIFFFLRRPKKNLSVFNTRIKSSNQHMYLHVRARNNHTKGCNTFVRRMLQREKCCMGATVRGGGLYIPTLLV